MFLHTLSEREKQAYLRIAQYALNIDYDFSVCEENMLRNQCKEMEISYDELDLSDFDLEKELAIFDTEQTRRIVFMEITSLMFMDKHLASHEKRLLDRIDRYFDFDDDVMNQVTQYARQFIDAYYRGRKLVYNNGNGDLEEQGDLEEV